MCVHDDDLAAAGENIPKKVYDAFVNYSSSPSTDLQQRVYELIAIMNSRDSREHLLPKDASCEELDIDASLSFLDDYVQVCTMGNRQSY